MKIVRVIINRDRKGGFRIGIESLSTPLGVHIYASQKDEFVNLVNRNFGGVKPLDIISAFDTAEEYGESMFKVLAESPTEVAMVLRSLFESKKDKSMKEVNYMSGSGTFKTVDSEGNVWEKIKTDVTVHMVKKIDSTHFAIIEEEDFNSSGDHHSRPVIYHVAEFKSIDSEFYEELVKWLKGREMIGGKSFMESNKNKTNIIEIKEEVSIIQGDGTKVILEKGDKVEILNKIEERGSYPRKNEFIKALHAIYKEFTSEMEEMDVTSGAYFNVELMRLIEEAQRRL